MAKGNGKRVVVAGAGYAGITASVMLDGKVDLTVIDRKGYHEMLTRAHMVAGGLDDVQYNIVMLSEVLKGRDTKIIRSTIKSIDLNERKVSLYMDGYVRDIGYDYLIIALGGEVEYYNVNGSREHAVGFRSMEDALNIRRRLKALRDGASVVIVGGGATGISLAGALSTARLQGKKIRINVVEALDRILYGWDEYIVDRSMDMLDANGVNVMIGKKVVKVCDGSIITDDGEEIKSDLTIWTAGVRGSSVEIVPKMDRVKGYRIEVDGFSRVKGYDDVYAVGDISAFKLDGYSHYTPQLAQYAVRQGYRVAINILNLIKGNAQEPLLFKMRGSILSLGNYCVGVIDGIRLEGELCRYIEEFITYNYRSMLYGDCSARFAYEDDPLSSMINLSRALAYVSTRYTLANLSRLYTIMLGLHHQEVLKHNSITASHILNG